MGPSTSSQFFTLRAYLSPTLAQVELDGGVGVDGVPLVRIDRHTEQARVGLYEFTNKKKLVSRGEEKMLRSSVS